MYKLTDEQIKEKECFINEYVAAENAASGSQVDANANVTHKTMATLEAELFKADVIQINRAKALRKIRSMFGAELADNFIDDIRNHRIYIHDESSLKPYCASISLYPFLLEGTKCLGGVSKAPQNLQSFCGGFVNLVYQVSACFAGAIATVEFLHYFDYFARKQYGKNYVKTHRKEIEQELQGVVYALNQPASARGDQSVFWNISLFDKDYMMEMFGSFFYPDGSTVDFDSVRTLQYFFMEWFREERTKELLTFPVVTASLLTDGEKPQDETFVDFLSTEMARGNSFFVYMSDSVDSLASCCRLRNELADNTFSFTLGAGGVVTGSAQVITINFNRVFQDHSLYGELIQRVQKYLLAYKAIYKGYIDAGMLPAYTAGFMDIDKQFLTIGVNGFVEAFEYMGREISPNSDYIRHVGTLLSCITRLNKEAYKEYGVRFNTEMVPAENLGVKNAKWDKQDGLRVNRDCYNSYFYIVEDEHSDILDKIMLHGKEITQYLDGGSALHLNLQQLLTVEQAHTLFELCAKNGVSYWTTNTRCTICETCGHINPETKGKCVECGSRDVSFGTRIIGYLRKIASFSKERIKEHSRRFYM